MPWHSSAAAEEAISKGKSADALHPQGSKIFDDIDAPPERAMSSGPTPEQMVDAMHDLHFNQMKQLCPRMHTIARKCPFRTPVGHVPHLPVTCQSFPAELVELGLLYIGVQAPAKEDCSVWRAMMLEKRNAAHDPPFETAHSAYVDPQGSFNEMFILYFDSFSKADAWLETSGFNAWFGGEPGPLGYWLETMKIPFDHAETMYMPGAAANPGRYAYGIGKKGIDGGYYPTNLCNYSGSARDRIPCSGMDRLEGIVAELQPNEPDETKGQRVKLSIPPNISVIRSGQDWAASEGEVRANYLKKMAVVLKKGMDFLADPVTGTQSGTICNRFVTTLDEDGNELESTYGFCYSISLGKLEEWADFTRDPETGKCKGHSTHNAIYESFNAAMANGPAGLAGVELFHEVYTTPAEGCYAEYVNCHNRTGFLGWASGPQKLW